MHHDHGYHDGILSGLSDGSNTDGNDPDSVTEVNGFELDNKESMTDMLMQPQVAGIIIIIMILICMIKKLLFSSN